MKKNIVVLLLLIGTSFLANAQGIGLPQTELSQKLCRTWTTSYAMVGEMMVRPKANAGFDMLFKPDHTYTASNDKSVGNWRYDIKKKRVELSVGDKITARIVSISEKELVLVLVDAAGGPKNLPQVQTHLIPKK